MGKGRTPLPFPPISGAGLRRLLDEKEMSAAAFARLHGLKYQSVCQFAQGKSKGSVGDVLKIRQIVAEYESGEDA